MEKRDLKPGDVVQFNPMTVGNRAFAGCFAIVTELREWGALVGAPGFGTRDEFGGTAYYRAKWDEIEFVGRAAFVPGSDAAE